MFQKAGWWIIILAIFIINPVRLIAESKDQSKKNKSDWIDGSEMNTAIKKAQETGRPIVFLYRFRNSTCGLHNAKCSFWENSRELKDFVKVVFYSEDEDEEFNNKVRKQVRGEIGEIISSDQIGKQPQKEPELKIPKIKSSRKPSSPIKLPEVTPGTKIILPRLYITDDNLKLIACIPDESPEGDFPDFTKKVLDEFGPIHDAAALKSIRKKIEEANTNIAKENYQTAIAQLFQLEKQKNRSAVFNEVNKLWDSLYRTAEEKLAAVKSACEQGKDDEARQELVNINKEFGKLEEIAEQVKETQKSLDKKNNNKTAQ